MLTLSQAHAWLGCMDSHEAAGVVEELITLVGEHYLDHEVAAKISETLATSLAAGRYRSDDVSLADAVTTDLQSVNGDKHLRLIYHAEVLPEREHGEDAAEYDAIARWADQTCFGIARVERLPGNVGYLDLQPVLFPAAIAGDAITAAMSLIAPTEALIIDLRACRGGDPATAAWLCSYLFRREPVQLTGLHEPRHGRTTQSWTLPFVPGRRFAATKPVYVLTSSATFSGGEQPAAAWASDDRRRTHERRRPCPRRFPPAPTPRGHHPGSPRRQPGQRRQLGRNRRHTRRHGPRPASP